MGLNSCFIYLYRVCVNKPRPLLTKPTAYFLKNVRRVKPPDIIWPSEPPPFFPLHLVPVQTVYSVFNFQSLTHSHLRVPLEILSAILYTFRNNLGKKRKIAKYFRESCCLSSDQHFSFICFLKKCFCKKNI